MSSTMTFGSLTIGYDEQVLEPRPWVLLQSQWARELLEDAPPGPVLELCTGAGHIGLVAVVGNDRTLVAVDANPDGLRARPVDNAVGQRAGRPRRGPARVAWRTPCAATSGSRSWSPTRRGCAGRGRAVPRGPGAGHRRRRRRARRRARLPGTRPPHALTRAGRCCCSWAPTPRPTALADERFAEVGRVGHGERGLCVHLQRAAAGRAQRSSLCVPSHHGARSTSGRSGTRR